MEITKIAVEDESGFPDFWLLFQCSLGPWPRWWTAGDKDSAYSKPFAWHYGILPPAPEISPVDPQIFAHLFTCDFPYLLLPRALAFVYPYIHLYCPIPYLVYWSAFSVYCSCTLILLHEFVHPMSTRLLLCLSLPECQFSAILSSRLHRRLLRPACPSRPSRWAWWGRGPDRPRSGCGTSGSYRKKCPTKKTKNVIRFRSFLCSKFYISILHNFDRLEYSFPSSIKRNQLMNTH